MEITHYQNQIDDSQKDENKMRKKHTTRKAHPTRIRKNGLFSSNKCFWYLWTIRIIEIDETYDEQMYVFVSTISHTKKTCLSTNINVKVIYQRNKIMTRHRSYQCHSHKFPF